MSSFSPGPGPVNVSEPEAHSDQADNNSDNSEVIDSVKSFYRQSHAVDFAVKTSSDTNKKFVFSYEVNRGGCRKFLVTSVDYFWSFYKTLHKSKRHYYEVIQTSTKAKLYFDCEYDIESNQQLNGHNLTRKFISFVNQRLLHVHGIRNSFQDVLILESSSETKFSTHIIFTQVYFENNLICGLFVKNLLRTLTEEEKNVLEVVSYRGRKSTFVDSGVYTRFRNLRLFLSKKLGKQTHFDISRIDTFSKKISYQERSEGIDFVIFKSSLVTYTSESSSYVTFNDNEDGGSEPEERLKSNLVTPSLVAFDLPTPFPEVDNFIKEYIYPSSLRSWVYFKDKDLYCLYTRNYRFCQNIKKHHTRNCTYFIFRLKELKLWQACHKCRGYYSSPIQLPSYLLKWMEDFAD